MGAKFRITFIMYFNGEPETYVVRGRAAETLACLVHAGQSGITALEVNSWAYRLASYIHDLRHKYGLDIHTIMEPHDGGEHARYRLITPVHIEAAGEDHG